MESIGISTQKKLKKEKTFVEACQNQEKSNIESRFWNKQAGVFEIE